MLSIQFYQPKKKIHYSFEHVLCVVFVVVVVRCLFQSIALRFDVFDWKRFRCFSHPYSVFQNCFFLFLSSTSKDSILTLQMPRSIANTNVDPLQRRVCITHHKYISDINKYETQFYKVKWLSTQSCIHIRFWLIVQKLRDKTWSRHSHCELRFCAACCICE